MGGGDGRLWGMVVIGGDGVDERRCDVECRGLVLAAFVGLGGTH